MLARLSLFAVVGLFAASFNSAQAALPPGAVKELLENAHEILEIEIIGVRKMETDREGRLRVNYTAKVLGKKRSVTGLAAGDKIVIYSYVQTKPFAGPLSPKLYNKGWRGTVYLRRSSPAMHYNLAAYGHSFQEAKNR